MAGDFSMRSLVVGDERGDRINTIAADEIWHYIGGSGEPAFSGTWVNYGSQYQPAAFRKDSMGWVHITGLVKSGTSTTAVFTLPVGYRSSKYLHFPSLSYDLIGGTRVVNESGIVTGTSANTGWFSFDHVTFKADM